MRIALPNPKPKSASAAARVGSLESCAFALPLFIIFLNLPGRTYFGLEVTKAFVPLFLGQPLAIVFSAFEWLSISSFANPFHVLGGFSPDHFASLTARLGGNQIFAAIDPHLPLLMAGLSGF